MTHTPEEVLELECRRLEEGIADVCADLEAMEEVATVSVEYRLGLAYARRRFMGLLAP